MILQLQQVHIDVCVPLHKCRFCIVTNRPQAVKRRTMQIGRTVREVSPKEHQAAIAQGESRLPYYMNRFINRAASNDL